MSRPKGSKNAPVKFEAPVTTLNEDVKYIQTVDEKYIIMTNPTLSTIQMAVNIKIDQGYVCQGGVSVTNYRGLDGNIVMVYAQAMVKCEG
jgi:hypothetical protein